MAFWLDIAAFLLKALIIVAAFGGLAVLIARLARSNEPKDQEIKVRSLDERYDEITDAMNGALLDRKERKALAKTRKKQDKAAAKTRRSRSPASGSMCSPSKATCARAPSSALARRSTPSSSPRDQRPTKR